MRVLVSLFVVGILSAPLARAADKPAEKPDLPLVYSTDFETADGWEPKEPTQWKLKDIIGDTNAGESLTVFSQFQKKSSYKPPHRSPENIAILTTKNVTDCELKVRVKSTHDDYGHRDVVLVFGYQDAAHFYYVHMAKEADDRANQIFIVNNEPRKKISLTTTKGTPWDDKFHEVKVVRKVEDGAIEVYFDDMNKPIMTAKDTTFAWGRIGVGTFDDTADFDRLELRGSLRK